MSSISNTYLANRENDLATRCSAQTNLNILNLPDDLVNYIFKFVNDDPPQPECWAPLVCTIFNTHFIKTRISITFFYPTVKDSDVQRIVKIYKNLSRIEFPIPNGWTRITDVALKTISTLINLEELHLSGCRNIGDDGIIFLSACTKLRVFSLTCSHIVSDAGIKSFLLACKSLEEFNLLQCHKITPFAFADLSSLKLQKLYISSYNITAAVLKILPNFKSLEMLNLSHWVKNDNVDFSDLSPCNKLQELTIDAHLYNDRTGIPILKKNLPNLKVVKNKPYDLWESSGLC